MPTRCVPFLVAIETDPSRYHGEQAIQPRPLDRSSSEQLLAHLAADLGRLFPNIHEFALVMPGALYDQSQLLRPGYPLLAELEPLLADSQTRSYAPGLLSIGAVDGQLPGTALQPDPNIPPGVLQLMTLLVAGEHESVIALSDEMEHRFMDEGQLSPACARALEAQFSIRINHARFMTLTDLEAMLRLQMEHFGFLSLWELLDAALREEPGTLDVIGGEGQQYRWDGERVIMNFETFDHWAQRGSGRELQNEQLESAYCEWTRGLRRYLLTLQAHGIEVFFSVPGHEGQVKRSFIREPSSADERNEVTSLTEHCPEDVGTLAVTVVNQDGVENYYPLSPEGLNHLHEHIRARSVVDTISFPGGIRFDPVKRCLIPDPETLDSH